MAVVGSQMRWSRAPVETLAAFMEATGIPTFVNGMARGMVDADGPHFLNRSRKYALKNADLVLVFGTPFDFRMSYGQSEKIVAGSQSGAAGSLMLNLAAPVIHKDAKIVQVDLDGDEIGRNRTRGVEVGLVADSGLVIEALTAGGGAAQRAAWNVAVRADESAKWAKMNGEIDAGAGPEDAPNPCLLYTSPSPRD